MNDYFLQAAARAHIDDLVDSAARGRRAREARKARRAEHRAVRARDFRDFRDVRDQEPATIDLREIAGEISTAITTEISTGKELTAICGR